MIMTALFAAVASTAFSIIFNVRGRNIIFAGICSALGYFAYLLSYHNGILAALVLASAVITLSSEVFARVNRTPVTLFLVAGLIPLVPGQEMFQLFVKLLEQKENEAILHFLNAIMQAGALAAGIMVVSVLIRFLPPLRRRNNKI